VDIGRKRVPHAGFWKPSLIFMCSPRVPILASRPISQSHAIQLLLDPHQKYRAHRSRVSFLLSCVYSSKGRDLYIVCASIGSNLGVPDVISKPSVYSLSSMHPTFLIVVVAGTMSVCFVSAHALLPELKLQLLVSTRKCAVLEYSCIFVYYCMRYHHIDCAQWCPLSFSCTRMIFASSFEAKDSVRRLVLTHQGGISPPHCT
jgi:hypothetical protein